MGNTFIKKDGGMEKKNYRPISALSCLEKVLEKIIFPQMGNTCIKKDGRLEKRITDQSVWSLALEGIRKGNI